jgi:hypothetical protein
MGRTSYFFERREFDDRFIAKPYYVYKGYFELALNESKSLRYQQEAGKPSADFQHLNLDHHYPVILHFGKDELVFSYRDRKGGVFRVFSLYVAEGQLNQQVLSKKVEDYWSMPFWQPARLNMAPIGGYTIRDCHEGGSGTEFELTLDHALLAVSYFPKVCGFEILEGRFVKNELLGNSSQSQCVCMQDNRLDFKVPKGIQAAATKHTWTLCRNTNNIIKSNYINFQQLILDFLFEQDYATTFEDENFFNLQPILQDNQLLDALSKRCHYLNELGNLRAQMPQGGSDSQESVNGVPSRFKRAEADWLNVCILQAQTDLFNSTHSVFKRAEGEIDKVIFHAQIPHHKKSLKTFGRVDSGPRMLPRYKTFSMNEDDGHTRSHLASFYMRRYSIWNALRLLMPINPFLRIIVCLLLGFSLLKVPLDGVFAEIDCQQGIELSSIIHLFVFPIIFLFHHIYEKINLFKLLMPRLFFGIIIGWSIYWGSEDVWKVGIRLSGREIAGIGFIVLLIFSLFVVTDITSRLGRHEKNLGVVAKRAGLLFVLALMISLIQGFYTTQLFAKPMLENSGILKASNDQLFTVPKITDPAEDCLLVSFHPRKCTKRILVSRTKTDRFNQIQLIGHESKCRDDDINMLYCLNNNPFHFKNYNTFEVPWLRWEIRYILSVLLSQGFLSILVGVVLQFLWEDRPITEPL